GCGVGSLPEYRFLRVPDEFPSLGARGVYRLLKDLGLPLGPSLDFFPSGVREHVMRAWLKVLCFRFIMEMNFWLRMIPFSFQARVSSHVLGEHVMRAWLGSLCSLS
nr:hypothetical protein [Tanacetum cinerariifolium]